MSDSVDDHTQHDGKPNQQDFVTVTPSPISNFRPTVSDIQQHPTRQFWPLSPKQKSYFSHAEKRKNGNNQDIIYFLHEAPNKGLLNQGSTCYLNSALQVLFMTKEFTDEAERQLTSSKDNELLRNLQMLFEDLRRGEKHVSTVKITKSLSITNVFEQQDAVEWFEKILSFVPEASQVFKGNLQKTMRCLKKNRTESVETNDFFTIPLSIDVRGKELFCVEDGLREFFTPTKFEEEDWMYCDDCEEKTDSEISFRIVNYPTILVLHLKRFYFDYMTMGFQKNHCPIQIPAKISYFKDQPYELYGVINHSGVYGGGHYNAYIKSPKNQHWYCFDDSYVHRVQEQDFLDRSCTAYMVVYRKQQPQDSRSDVNTAEESTCSPTPDKTPVGEISSVLNTNQSDSETLQLQEPVVSKKESSPLEGVPTVETGAEEEFTTVDNVPENLSASSSDNSTSQSYSTSEDSKGRPSAQDQEHTVDIRREKIVFSSREHIPVAIIPTVVDANHNHSETLQLRESVVSKKESSPLEGVPTKETEAEEDSTTVDNVPEDLNTTATATHNSITATENSIGQSCRASKDSKERPSVKDQEDMVDTSIGGTVSTSKDHKERESQPQTTKRKGTTKDENGVLQRPRSIKDKTSHLHQAKQRKRIPKKLPNRPAFQKKPNPSPTPPIAPGTVLRLTKGRHQGKRVVFLKHLPSGLLLLTGPFALNRVPLSRVSRAFVTDTGSKVDLFGLKIKTLTDMYVRRRVRWSFRNGHVLGGARVDGVESRLMMEELRRDEEDIDSKVLSSIRRDPELLAFLRKRRRMKVSRLTGPASPVALSLKLKRLRLSGKNRDHDDKIVQS